MKIVTSGLLISGCLLACYLETEFDGSWRNDMFKSANINIVPASVHSGTTSKRTQSSSETISMKEKYVTKNGRVSFFAEAPVADVDARNERVEMAFDASSGELTVNIVMSNFQFQNKKMGRDARRKYIEIDKFPKASFVGKITGKVDYDKPGSYPVTATGKLEVHGVEREVSERGTIKVQGGKIRIDSRFDVALKDHNIETPKILNQEMTADKVVVKLEATLSAASK